MTFRTGYSAPLGMPWPGAVYDTEVVPVGTIMKAFEDARGPSELIFLPGVANNAEGLMSVYDLNPGSEVVALGDTDVTAHLASGRPVAVALSPAPLAGQYGWYQIQGTAKVKVAAAFAANSLVFLTANGGIVDDAVVAGAQILGARGMSAIDTPATGFAYIQLNRPIVEQAEA